MLKDIIGKKLITCEPGTRVAEVAKLMDEANVGSVLVLDNEIPRGILTDRDIVVRCLAKNVDVEDCTVENVMTESLQTVKVTDGIYDCIRVLKAAGVRRIPVVDEDGKACGIVSFGDLLAVLAKEFVDLTATTTPTEPERARLAA